MRTIGEITFGSGIRGDGFDGEVGRLVVDAAGRVLTHVIVAPRHETGRRRLVPATMIDRTADGLRLRCTREEYEALSPAAGTEVVIDATAGSDPTHSRPLHRHTRAHAADGGAGWVRGLSVGADGITHYLLRPGVLRRRTVAVPVGAVRDVTDDVRVDMTKRRIRALPSPAAADLPSPAAVPTAESAP